MCCMACQCSERDAVRYVVRLERLFGHCRSVSNLTPLRTPLSMGTAALFIEMCNELCDEVDNNNNNDNNARNVVGGVVSNGPPVRMIQGYHQGIAAINTGQATDLISLLHLPGLSSCHSCLTMMIRVSSGWNDLNLTHSREDHPCPAMSPPLLHRSSRLTASQQVSSTRRRARHPWLASRPNDSMSSFEPICR